MSDEYNEQHEERAERPRDSKVDEARAALMERFFPADSRNVYYGRQLEVALETEFFHWITKKALNELAAERRINLAVEQTGTHRAHFYWPLGHRYPRRQIRKTLALIAEFSSPNFTRAVGVTGEQLIDAGFARIGFRIRQHKVREVNGLRWESTNHDLDRLVDRDRILYGVEIKNQLGYIDQTEFEIKLDMCRFFRVRPMFVARMMPKSYIHRVNRAGGFALLTGFQHYPLLSDDLAARVREGLGLPVRIVRELPDTTLSRFEKWHVHSLEHPPIRGQWIVGNEPPWSS
jgi:hypothetical protein